MKKIISTLLVSFLFFSEALLAQSVNPLDCLKKKRSEFFPTYIVEQAMAFQIGISDIYPSNWAPIIQRLQEKSYSIPEEMQKKAIQIIPNPFIYPYDYEIAKKMWMNLMRQTFQKVMLEFNITNPGVINEMFSYIEKNYLEPKFSSCFPIKQIQ